jgi:hypothetical protein
MRFTPFILLLIVVQAQAQIPRNSAGLFEYSQHVTVTPASRSLMKERIRTFFNQPFLIHWDSVAPAERNGSDFMTGNGYVNVRAKHHGVAIPKIIAVSVRLTIELKDSGYHYTVNHFAVNKNFHFTLEQKPAAINSVLYDQILMKTHKRISFVIGWLKRYMEGEAFDD